MKNISAATTAINLDADAIKKELQYYGAAEIARTVDTDYYFKMFTLKRVVTYARDISIRITNAID